MKILVTLDRSSLSELVLEPVARLARLEGAEVQFLTVVRPSEVSAELAETPSSRVHLDATRSGSRLGLKALGDMAPQASARRQQAIRRLETEAREYLRGRSREVPGVALKGVVLFDDDPAAAIVAHARREQVDLIAMATHGRTGLSHRLTGGVCERVIRAGVAPLMVLRPPEA
jgi:nucleotide-binding universal stress UspA family protein